MLSVAAAYHSDAGDRDRNEDRAAVFECGRVCLVADGIGGAPRGGVASGIAVQTVQKSVAHGTLSAAAADESLTVALRGVMERANRRIVDASHATRACVGMGTTLTLVVIGENALYFAHVGDSRLYHWRDGKGQQLTEDHTRGRELLQMGLPPDQVATLRHTNALVKFLGTTREVQPQLGSHRLRPGDRLLLCTDGLYNPLGPQTLWRTLGESRRAEDAARGLVAAAKRNSTVELDNVTALVVAVDG